MGLLHEREGPARGGPTAARLGHGRERPGRCFQEQDFIEFKCLQETTQHLGFLQQQLPQKPQPLPVAGAVPSGGEQVGAAVFAG